MPGNVCGGIFSRISRIVLYGNKNCEDMGVVASKRHESIMASLYHYFKRDSAVPSPHGALSSSVPSSAIDSWPTTVIEELIIATE